MPLSKPSAANPPFADLRHPRLSPHVLLFVAQKISVILSGASRSLIARSAVEGPRNRPRHPYRPDLSARSTRLLSSPIRCVLLALALFSTPLYAARNPDPPQRIPLTPFGFQTISERYLLQGATMVTVDFVDNDHLLVTFGISRLMPRLAECPAEDEDRTVKAVLLELPSGRELASTEWRFHDLGQYLWSLGDGYFLLRNRDNLTTIAPLQNLGTKPFAQTPFLHFTRRVEAIIVSADHDLLAIETTKPKPHAVVDPMLQVSAQPSSLPNSTPASSAPAPHSPGLLRRDPNAAPSDSQPVEITFLRLLRVDPAQLEPPPPDSKQKPPQSGTSESAHAPTRIVAQLEARVHTDKVISFPLTTEGFLETRAESRNGVLFHFITYTGKDLDLGDFATSCHPRPTFISHSEFVTYGCRGAEESLDLAGFNLRGDLIWQINFSDNQAYPSFASAPAAGRFAFSRTITTSNVFGSETPSASQLTAQEIRVVQMYNGKQLLRAVASPIQRAGQNYALAPDGLTLAVIHDLPASPVSRGEGPLHDTAVELFRLPALSPKDLAEMKTEADMAPPPSGAPMHFSLAEIKAAQNQRIASSRTSDADSKIVGDTIAPPPPQGDSPTTGLIVGDASSTNASGTIDSAKAATKSAPSAATIPASDPAPACAGLTEKTVAACPASATPRADAASPAKADSDAAPEPEKRRKPPTLYEPAPTSPPPPQ